MRSIAVKAADAHSTRFGNSRGNCIRVKFIKRGEKKFFTLLVQRDYDWSNRQVLTQKDRKRHRQSDKNR